MAKVSFLKFPRIALFHFHKVAWRSLQHDILLSSECDGRKLIQNLQSSDRHDGYCIEGLRGLNCHCHLFRLYWSPWKEELFINIHKIFKCKAYLQLYVTSISFLSIQFFTCSPNRGGKNLHFDLFFIIWKFCRF